MGFVLDSLQTLSLTSARSRNTISKRDAEVIPMGNRTFVIGIAFISLLLAAAPASAHHSFAAEYDAKKPVTITGVVTKIDWMNPHVYFYVDVKDANSKV